MTITSLPIGHGNCYVEIHEGPDINEIKRIEDELLTGKVGHFVEVRCTVSLEKDGQVSEQLSCTLAISSVSSYDGENPVSLSIKQDGRYAHGIYDPFLMTGYVDFIDQRTKP